MLSFGKARAIHEKAGHREMSITTITNTTNTHITTITTTTTNNNNHNNNNDNNETSNSNNELINKTYIYIYIYIHTYIHMIICIYMNPQAACAVHEEAGHREAHGVYEEGEGLNIACFLLLFLYDLSFSELHQQLSFGSGLTVEGEGLNI